MNINASEYTFSELNQAIRNCNKNEIHIKRCMGHRFIASGMREKNIIIEEGIPGNALGAYLDGASITIYGNVQDAVGDTMNDGSIHIHGSAGDTAGYAMRGGSIFIRDNVGYRAGIHMKSYMEKRPLLVIGGCAGSFLGEYQAGGTILVLNSKNQPDPVGKFCGTGMHGGRIFLRMLHAPSLPPQVSAHIATSDELKDIQPHIDEFCRLFGDEYEFLSESTYIVLTPNKSNPYHQMYTSW